MMHFTPWQWVIVLLAAIVVGISKTGVSGLGLLAVTIFAQVIPAKQSTGLVLPLLIVGDIVAVASYRQHTQWAFLWKLFPSTAVGVVLGALTLRRLDNRQVEIVIGAIVLALLVLHLVRRWRGGAASEPESGIGFALLVGVLAGFTTLMANAAGPLMAIYLLAMRLPKLEFVGTGAMFFLLLNLFKVPFMIGLGLITTASFSLNLCLVPAVLVGTWIGRKLLARINQRLFENLALLLSAAAGAKLLF